MSTPSPEKLDGLSYEAVAALARMHFRASVGTPTIAANTVDDVFPPHELDGNYALTELVEAGLVRRRPGRAGRQPYFELIDTPGGNQ